MNKRIKKKVDKRRANSPKMVELRRWLMELATAKRDYEAMKEGRLPLAHFSQPAPPSQNVLTRNYHPAKK